MHNFKTKTQLKQNMKDFWRERLTEISEAPPEVRGEQALPLTRIKKVMKSDEQVKMISADTPVVFAKACEMFIMELSVRAWMHTHKNKRRTLQRNDVANAIREEDLLLFLKDTVPMETHQEDFEINYGVYGSLPNYSMNMQSIIEPSEGAVSSCQVATGNGLTFPSNLQNNTNPSFFTRIQEMQEISGFPSPSTADNP